METRNGFQRIAIVFIIDVGIIYSAMKVIGQFTANGLDACIIYKQYKKNSKTGYLTDVETNERT